MKIKCVILVCMIVNRLVCFGINLMTSPNHSFLPGNVYHHYGSSKSKETSTSARQLDPAVYVKNVDDLVFDLEQISSVWLRYDFQCMLHPDEWAQSVPGCNTSCDFQKRLHYIGLIVAGQKYMVMFSAENYEKLDSRLEPRFNLPVLHDPPVTRFSPEYEKAWDDWLKYREADSDKLDKEYAKRRRYGRTAAYSGAGALLLTWLLVALAPSAKGFQYIIGTLAVVTGMFGTVALIFGLAFAFRY